MCAFVFLEDKCDCLNPQFFYFLFFWFCHQEVAKKVGEAIAKSCLEKGITKVVFDRGGFRYHGRVEALANAAREHGLVFWILGLFVFQFHLINTKYFLRLCILYVNEVCWSHFMWKCSLPSSVFLFRNEHGCRIADLPLV